MTAGDVAYAVRHCYDRKTEGESGEQISARGCAGTYKHCCAAAEEYKYKSAYTFSYVLFYGS